MTKELQLCLPISNFSTRTTSDIKYDKFTCLYKQIIRIPRQESLNPFTELSKNSIQLISYQNLTEPYSIN